VESCTIYCLKDPTTDAVRYVGKTNDLPARLRSHRWERRNLKLQNRKVRWLRTLTQEPLVEVLEVVDMNSWADRERYWIKRFRDEGADLTNFADGGQTSPVEGRGHTEETKAKLRTSALARGIRPPSRAGQPVSAITRAKLRDAAIKRGAKPPPMGGWNKGQEQTHCSRGHERSKYGYYQDGRYRNCKRCQAERGAGALQGP